LERDELLQRAAGAARLIVDGSHGTNRITDAFQQHPVRIMFPRLAGQAIGEIVLVNTSGGVAGADAIDVSIGARRGASITVSSQAAEKVYRSLGQPARIDTQLKVEEGATLAWLPQETILFNRSRLLRTTQISLDGTGALLALEWLVLGRAGHGETLTDGDIAERWYVRIRGRLQWADCFRLSGSVFSELHRHALLSGCTALATLVYFGPQPERQLELFRQWRSLADCQIASTCINGLIIVRMLAPTAASLRGALRFLLGQFAREFGSERFQVPKVWGG